jgi:hypothetical protein
MWWPAHQIQVLIRLLHSPPSNTTAAGAGAFFVCCWSYALPPKRRDDEEDGKYLDNDGHITVAGETPRWIVGRFPIGYSPNTTVGDAESSISPPWNGRGAPSRR